MWAVLLGFDGSTWLADAVGEPRMAFDEVGSRLLRILELADLNREPGLLAFEGLSVRFGRALPGTIGRLQRRATGPAVFAVSVRARNPRWGFWARRRFSSWTRLATCRFS